MESLVMGFSFPYTYYTVFWLLDFGVSLETQLHHGGPPFTWRASLIIDLTARAWAAALLAAVVFVGTDVYIKRKRKRVQGEYTDE
jgi:hypothetical protein